MNAEQLHVLIVGAGMYVCGRGTRGYGTVLPTMYQARKEYGIIRKVTVCATTRSSIDVLNKKNAQLRRLFKVDLPLEGFPEKGDDQCAYKKLIESPGRNFDCAIVVVPDHRHHEIAENILKAGIHTFIVKPFVPEVDNAIRLIELAEKNKLYGSIEFHKRYDQANIKLRDEILAGKVGKPLYFHIEYSQRKCIPEQIFAQWAHYTNIFQYLGVHYADLIYFLT
jgi:predicted dehydrogenase